ncbi:MAG: hypothetical protein ACPHXR_05210 [Flavicella sp.]
MSKNILNIPFWKLALRYSLVFIVVIAVLLTIISLIENGNFNAIKQSINDGSWKSYAINRIVLAVVYGVAMAFFSKRKARNLNKR